MPDVPAQLPKLLRMLGSSYDHEVLAAARKISAAAAAYNIDWDQLCANGSGLNEEQFAKIYTEGLRRGEELGYERGLADGQAATPTRSPAPDPYAHLATDFDWAQRIMDAAAKPAAARVLNQRTLEFCESYRERMRDYGPRARIYPKQRDWLKDIESRLKYAGIIG